MQQQQIGLPDGLRQPIPRQGPVTGNAGSHDLGLQYAAGLGHRRADFCPGPGTGSLSNDYTNVPVTRRAVPVLV